MASRLQELHALLELLEEEGWSTPSWPAAREAAIARMVAVIVGRMVIDRIDGDVLMLIDEVICIMSSLRWKNEGSHEVD